MATKFGDSSTLDAATLLARLSDEDEEISDSDDSFDYLEAGMAAGELDEVSSSVFDVRNFDPHNL